MATKITKKLALVMQENFADNLLASYANNQFFGNPTEGNDTIIADHGNQLIIGLFGEDTLKGGNGNDALHGEFDYFLFNFPVPPGTEIFFQDDEIFGENGNDLLVGDIGHLDLIPSTPLNNVLAMFGNDKLFGGNGDDVLCGDQLLENTIVAFDFTSVHAHWGSDELFGGKGNDILVGDVLHHNEIIHGPESDLDLQFVHDHLMGGDKLFGGDGNDILVGDEGTFIFTANGNVHLEFTQHFGDDELDGGQGNDILVGDVLSFSYEHGPDVDNEIFELFFGDDTLTGGQGNDILYGDFITLDVQTSTNIMRGSDTFVFDLRVNDGHDQIIDFESATDNLQFMLTSVSGNTVADIDAHIISISGSDSEVTVRFDTGGVIDFENIAFTGQDSIADLVDNSTIQIQVLTP